MDSLWCHSPPRLTLAFDVLDIREIWTITWSSILVQAPLPYHLVTHLSIQIHICAQSPRRLGLEALTAMKILHCHTIHLKSILIVEHFSTSKFMRLPPIETVYYMMYFVRSLWEADQPEGKTSGGRPRELKKRFRQGFELRHSSEEPLLTRDFQSSMPSTEDLGKW